MSNNRPVTGRLRVTLTPTYTSAPVAAMAMRRGSAGSEGFSHRSDAVGNAVYEHSGAGGRRQVHVVGDERPVAEREVEHDHVAGAPGEAVDESLSGCCRE